MAIVFSIFGGLFVGMLLLLVGAYLFWRYYWFWRNPPRTTPAGEHLVSPADGVVVYVKRAAPSDPVVCYKEDKAASINDIAREDFDVPKILIGIFMSPFGVHYNRAPLTSKVAYKKQHPAEGKNLHMGSMAFRSLFNKLPLYDNSPHIVQNNRAVTRFVGELLGRELACYVVQIGAAGVNGIDVHFDVGQEVQKGEVFGMIRIGSQVDLVAPDWDECQVLVKPGDRVVAGETILIAPTRPDSVV